MARIPEQEIERLKQEVSIKSLVTNRGVRLKKHGADWIGLCPFHADKEPSLVVSPQKGLWHCLGACQTGGSVIDWVMKAEGVSFRHAVELLREGHTTNNTKPKTPVTKSTTNKIPIPFDKEIQDKDLLLQVIDFYHETLKQSPEALGYLEKRGLTNPEMLQRFKLGFANRTLGYRLPFKNRQTGAELRGRLQKLGIMRQSGHEHFSGSLIIPVFDEHGQVVEAYGRKVNQRLRKGTPLHLYLPGPHQGVWNMEAVKVSEEIILCESLIDALTFWCAGFRNVTASYGIEGFTNEHLKAFEIHQTKRVLIAYDRDQAGDQAASELADKLIAKGLECYRIQFPKGMDANEYACKVQPASKSLDVVVRKAIWLGKGKEPKRAPLAGACVDLEQSLTRAAKGKGDCVEQQSLDGSCDPQPVAAPQKPIEPQEALPAASPEPAPPIKADIQGEEITIRFGNRRWRIRGMHKNLSYELMKVNVLVSKLEDPSVEPNGVSAFHVDTLDMYVAKQRNAYIKQAAEELRIKEEVIKKDLGNVLLKLEELQEKNIKQKLEPKKQEIELSDQERQAALSLLKDPNLLDRILADFEKCGVVGEEINKLTGYLASISRKLEEPLAVVIQSSSAAGKTSLMEAVLSFVPEEERVQYSAMTGQSLFYMGESDLKHKVLAIVEEEGAERASYALKLLQSEGKLTIASTGKDPQTGRLITHEYHVEGPVMIFLTTTAIEVDEELLNRCLVLSVCEEREQTKKIHQLQRDRQTLAGLLARQDRKVILNTHQNAQRLLRPLLVANPYAPSLTFLDNQTRTRRDHMKYLTLIRTIALLHQYQRPLQRINHNGKTVQYIEVSKQDIQLANRLAHEVLGRSLDELPPQTRRFLIQLTDLVKQGCKQQGVEQEDYRFTRREIREHLGLGNTQARIHLSRLVEMEYVVVHHGARGQQYVYELAYDGNIHDHKSFMSQLIDANQLQSYKYDANLAGQKYNLAGSKPELAGCLRVQNGPKTGGVRGDENQQKPLSENELQESEHKNVKTAVKGKEKTLHKSYVLIDPIPSSGYSNPIPLAAAKSQGSL